MQYLIENLIFEGDHYDVTFEVEIESAHDMVDFNVTEIIKCYKQLPTPALQRCEPPYKFDQLIEQYLTRDEEGEGQKVLNQCIKENAEY